MTQNDAILDWLQRGPITARQAALELGVWRLSARVCELRRLGHPIDTETVGGRLGVRFARYRLGK